jgi:hypothetical protein
MNAKNITSSLSNREKMRRKPLSRRNSLSISLRRPYALQGDPMGALGVADGLNGFECPGNALALILD